MPSQGKWLVTNFQAVARVGKRRGFQRFGDMLRRTRNLFKAPVPADALLQRLQLPQSGARSRFIDV
jgi:hypothetical protein